ncbi:ferredoxin [Mariprofundus sp. KV]|uniref:(2Fe-2S) ferredoxin domain-containing protein n=1 Tax=Mariprofundus sp. KV TaxID=2608715 RepID=UPI0015A2B244|nr:ferredoxin [Mariprofundus sp. KV]NWF36712.1 ferredoxin [Mariprofundus sp. KV]
MPKPMMMPYKRHAIMCCGKSCGENLPLLNYLKDQVVAAGLVVGDPDAVRVNRAGCLGVCMEGPVMVVYPEGVWYCNLNQSAIDRIIEEHFRGGRVVEEFAFYKM